MAELYGFTKEGNYKKYLLEDKLFLCRYINIIIYSLFIFIIINSIIIYIIGVYSNFQIISLIAYICVSWFFGIKWGFAAVLACALANFILSISGEWSQFVDWWLADEQPLGVAAFCAELFAVYFICRLRDVCADLWDAREFASTIFRAMGFAAFVVDAEGQIEMASGEACEMFRYGADELIGTCVFRLGAIEHREVYEKDKADLLARGNPRVSHVRRGIAVRKDLTRFPAEATIIKFSYKGDIKFICRFRDISVHTMISSNYDRDKINDIGNIMISTEYLSRIFVHEISQPTSALLNYINTIKLLVERDVSKNEMSRVFNKSIDQVDRIKRITFKLARLFESGSCRRVPGQINRVIEDSVVAIMPDIVKHGIVIRTNLSRSIGAIGFDRILIGQVMSNLIRNSIDALHDSDMKAIC